MCMLKGWLYNIISNSAAIVLQYTLCQVHVHVYIYALEVGEPLRIE